MSSGNSTSGVVTRFEDLNGGAVWVNFDSVAVIRMNPQDITGESSEVVLTTGQGIVVQGDPDSIIRLIVDSASGDPSTLGVDTDENGYPVDLGYGESDEYMEANSH